MSYLISDLNKIGEKLKIDVIKFFISPKLTLDSPLMAIPYILKCRNKNFILVDDSEKGNILALDLLDLLPFYYNQYFLVSKKLDEFVKKNVFELLDIINNNYCRDEVIHIDNNLPYLFYKQLKKIFPNKKILYQNEPFIIRETNIYSINVQDICKKFNIAREKGADCAKKLLVHLPDAKLLEGIIQNIKDSRFRLINEFMIKENISTILVNSPLNFQEIAGVSIKNSDNLDIMAIYHQGDEKVYIVSEKKLVNRNLKNLGTYSDFYTALSSICQKMPVLGIEYGFIDISRYKKLSEMNIDLKDTGPMLRRWREFRAGEDLAFYIIAGQASKYAMEETLKFSSKEIKKGIYLNEEQLSKKYFEYFKEYKTKNTLEYNFTEYFTEIYASNRTLYPSTPTNFVIDEETNEIKIDAGILLLDKKGLILATTDISRTLPLSVHSKEAYNSIKNTVKNLIIPSIKPGKTFEAVYFEGVRNFSNKIERLMKVSDLCPLNFNIKTDYHRDIGHLLSKQQPTDLRIKRGNKNIIKEGFIGCAEIQWQYKKDALAYEDMFFLGREKAINLSC